MEVIKNKYGSLVFEISPDGKDMSVTAYDENGNLVVGRDACRKKRKEILDEEKRLAKENEYGSTNL